MHDSIKSERPDPNERPMIRIEVFTRSNCPLCDELDAHLQRLSQELPLAIEWIDISTSSALEKAHGERIPVVWIEGRERFFGRVEPMLLRRTLRAEARKGSWWSRLGRRRSGPERP